jgi:hypothetical protein
MEIKLDVSSLTQALERLMPELDRAFEGAMAESMDIVAQEAAIRAPLVTGELVLSINAAPVTGTLSAGTLLGTVSSSLPRALWVEEGTKAHVILPRKKKALRWASNGTGAEGWRFAKKVNHPGTKAKPFLKPALASKREAIESKFEAATRLAIRKAVLR